MMRWDSYWLLGLYIPALWIFHRLTTWLTCRPLSELTSLPPGLRPESIPSSATCFVDSHHSLVAFLSFPPIETALVEFGGLALLLLGLVALVVRPSLRLMSQGTVRRIFRH